AYASTAWTRGLSANSADTSSAPHDVRWTAPARHSAAKRSMIAPELAGVIAEGRTTVALPAPKLAASATNERTTGALPASINPTTPNGSLRIQSRDALDMRRGR